MAETSTISASPEDAAGRLATVRAHISEAVRSAGRTDGDVALVAVSKTFGVDEIRPVIAAGQRIFGENRVQEAAAKWSQLRAETPDIELHLIGPLQSNKTHEAVALFDVVHTVDRPKIVRSLAAECAKQGRALRFFVQVNTGEEPQKAGVAPDDLASLLAVCAAEGLPVIGLMCIPPVDEPPALHFALLQKLARAQNLAALSMGMSADYETAIAFGATHVRVGSAIFGGRPAPA